MGSLKTLEITSCVLKKDGMGRNGKPYKLFALTAVDPNSGEQIGHDINSWNAEVPLGQALFDITEKPHPQYGMSWDVKAVNGEGATTVSTPTAAPSSSELDRRVGALEAEVQALRELVRPAGAKSDDDIPF